MHSFLCSHLDYLKLSLHKNIKKAFQYEKIQYKWSLEAIGFHTIQFFLRDLKDFGAIQYTLRAFLGIRAELSYLCGEENGSYVREVDGEEALGGAGEYQHVGEAQQWDEHDERLGRLAVLLRLHRVGRPQLRDQHLLNHKR